MHRLFPLFLVVVGSSFILLLTLGSQLTRYGFGILLSPESKRLAFSPEEHRAFLDSHRFVLIGGSHRGGTTLLWRLLTRHPDTSGFDENSDTDFGEGAFLQTVIPTFGIGKELTFGGGVHRRGANAGLGRYAFSPDSHLTEAHSLNTHASSQRLVDEWAFHWNTSRTVLLEKTPTNMMTSRLLQSLLAPSVNFLFITRHPLAVSLAHMRWPCCSGMSVSSLLLHWIVSHQVLASDMPHLRAAKVLRYEDLVQDPSSCIKDVLRWLQLPTGVASLPTRDVASNTNRKYENEYCSRHLDSQGAQEEHCAMAVVLQPELDKLQLGYNVLHGGSLGFACIRETIRQGHDPKLCEHTPSSVSVRRSLDGMQQLHSNLKPLPLGGHAMGSSTCLHSA